MKMLLIFLPVLLFSDLLVNQDIVKDVQELSIGDKGSLSNRAFRVCARKYIHEAECFAFASAVVKLHKKPTLDTILVKSIPKNN